MCTAAFAALIGLLVCVAVAQQRARSRHRSHEAPLDFLRRQRHVPNNYTVDIYDAVQSRCKGKHAKPSKSDSEQRRLSRDVLRVLWRATQATGVRFGLYRGTFLGWLRECDVNELDHDIDLVVLADDFSRERGVDMHWLHLALVDAGVHRIGRADNDGGIYKHYMQAIDQQPYQLLYLLELDGLDAIDIWIARRRGDFLWTSNNECNDYSVTRTHTLRRTTMLGVDTFVPAPVVDYANDFVGNTWSSALRVTQADNSSRYFPGYRARDCREMLE